MTTMTSVAALADDIAARTEAWLLEFFGTREEAERLAHLYVIECEPVTVDTSTDAMSVRAAQVCRIRLKTKEELSADAGQ